MLTVVNKNLGKENLYFFLKHNRLAYMIMFVHILYSSEDWKNEYFLVFPNKVEFAKYELEDGWYEGLGLEVVQGTEYKGAVNPFNYIDYKRLADDLIKNWDRSLYYESDEGKIVRTSYGF